MLCRCVAAVGWLLERGCEVDADLCAEAVKGAVAKSDVAVLTLLSDRGLLLVSKDLCKTACEFGFRVDGRGQLLTLQCLHEQAQCPWNRLALAETAATARKVGSFAVLRYILAQGKPSSPAALTRLLNCTVSCRNIIKARWLREQGAEWPAELVHAYGTPWSDRMITWATREGYKPQAV